MNGHLILDAHMYMLVYQVMWHIAGCEHIVQLHGVYEDMKSIHLVMDLCRGGELFDTIVAAGKLHIFPL